MKSSGMRIVGMLVWLITALASINIGLMPFGYDVFKMPTVAAYGMYIAYVIGAAGIISLIMMFTHAGCDCHHPEMK